MGVNFKGGDTIDVPSGSDGSDGYMKDLWGMTAKGAGLEPHLDHPDFPGSTSLNIQAGQYTVLYPRDEAAQRNAADIQANPSHYIPPYHQDRPIIAYRTDTFSTDDLSRAHGSDNQVGVFATRTSDIQDPSGVYHSASQIQQDLNLPKLPDQVSSVYPGPGTDIIASRPVSGNVRQYELAQLAASWFGNPLKLD